MFKKVIISLFILIIIISIIPFSSVNADSIYYPDNITNPYIELTANVDGSKTLEYQVYLPRRS